MEKQQEDAQGDDTNEDSSSPVPVLATPRSYPVWHNIVAGGVSGFGSRMVTAPLDLIRIRRQLTRTTLTYPRESMLMSWRNIVKNEGGITALYRGNAAAIYLWVGYSAVQFSLYNKTREALVTIVGFPSSAAAFGGGAFAGVCATLATYPFDVCRTTFAATGMVDSSFSSSSVPSSSSQPSQPNALQTSRAPPPSPPPPRQPMPFSSLVEPHYIQHDLHPMSESKQIGNHQKLQKRKFTIKAAVAARGPPPPPSTFSEFCIQLYQQKGIHGFYAGAGPAVIQIIPYMGLNFTIYDYLTSSGGGGSGGGGDRSRGSVALSGYAGAISGAVSKMIVYPCDTIKRRLQAQAFFDAGPQQLSATAILDSNITEGGVQSSRYYYTGMMDCMKTIARHEGWQSFFRGAVPSVLKTAISSSLAFSLFRFSKNTLETIDDHYYQETSRTQNRVD